LGQKAKAERKLGQQKFFHSIELHLVVICESLWLSMAAEAAIFVPPKFTGSEEICRLIGICRRLYLLVRFCLLMPPSMLMVEVGDLGSKNGCAQYCTRVANFCMKISLWIKKHS
jgi:hypothetical protein